MARRSPPWARHSWVGAPGFCGGCVTRPYFVAITPAFVRHPKLLELGSPRDRWTWLEVLCYAAEYRTGGEVPAVVSRVVRGANENFLARCVGIGLLEENPLTGTLTIHDWDEFNGAQRERLLARERKRRERENVTL